jgi:uncharacterized membrane protein YgaE (UPF0421/DUF939 family)
VSVVPTVGLESRPGAATPVPRSRAEWFDRFIGSDPGLNRFRMALQSVLTVALILGAEWVFVRLTHALQLPIPSGRGPAAAVAQVAVANHEYLVIGMLLGAIIGMISSFGVSDATARGQLVTTLFLPLPMIGALALGIALGGYRLAALISLVVVLALGTYCRRFGPRGMIVGMLLFMGDFFGFFLHGAVTLSDMGWLSAEIGVGVAVALVVRFVVFYPRPKKALGRAQRSYDARASGVAASALSLFDDPEHRHGQVRRLHRQLVRLNEAALMIDAQLGDSSAVADGSSSQGLHQRLFDAELALTNVARFAQAMSRLNLGSEYRDTVRRVLLAVVSGDTSAARAEARSLLSQCVPASGDPTDDTRTAVVIVHRFAASVIDLADASEQWASLGEAFEETDTFQPAVRLFGGWLPGSAEVSASASSEPDRRGQRHSLAPYTRTAIQMGVAVGLAVVLGDVLSSRRFYWAVIAAFITFMGANNSGEQARKAMFRVLGTLVGIGIGSLLAHAIGHHTDWSIAVILFSLFFGFYFMRVRYAFMVVGITVMVSQLYVQLGEFSNSLLVLRLEETALGAAVAIAVVMLVVPLHTLRVVRVAMRAHVEAVNTLVEHATDRLLDHEPARNASVVNLRADGRGLDASYQSLVTTAQPLRRNLVGAIDEPLSSSIRLVAASRDYGRNLIADIGQVGDLDPQTRLDVAQGSRTLHRSLEVVAASLNGPRDGTYTRSSSLFDQAERRLESSSGGIAGAQLAIRDLMLIDQAMARLAEIMHLTVTDFDTTLVGVTPAG